LLDVGVEDVLLEVVGEVLLRLAACHDVILSRRGRRNLGARRIGLDKLDHRGAARFVP
jgi:hypothetical protein